MSETKSIVVVDSKALEDSYENMVKEAANARSSYEEALAKFLALPPVNPAWNDENDVYEMTLASLSGDLKDVLSKLLKVEKVVQSAKAARERIALVALPSPGQAQVHNQTQTQHNQTSRPLQNMAQSVIQYVNRTLSTPALQASIDKLVAASLL
jgi:hypothetical protein